MLKGGEMIAEENLTIKSNYFVWIVIRLDCYLI